MISISTTERIRRTATVTALGLILAVGGGATAHADPSHSGKPRGSHAQPQKQRMGGSYTRHTEVQRTDQGRTRTDTWTGENGKVATRAAQVVNDPASQTRTRDVQWTGPNGGTATRQTVATHDASSDTWTRDVTVDRNPPPADGG